MASAELIQRFAKDELKAIKETPIEDIRKEYLHAGSYVHSLQEGGFTHWEANRINDVVRESIWRRLSELGGDPSKEAPY